MKTSCSAWIVIVGVIFSLVLNTEGKPVPNQNTKKESPLIVGHRGLMRDAPENTLAGFAACLHLRLGFELDVRRSSDDHLICLHDETLDRTTNGKGPVQQMPLKDLRRLDAGSKFGPAFSGERIPTLEEVFSLMKKHSPGKTMVALDLKIWDETLAAEIAGLVKKYDVADQLVCIGLTISDETIRRKLGQTKPALTSAVLAQTEKNLRPGLQDPWAKWIYVRFVPTSDQVAEIHRAGKKVFLVGPTVAGHEPENWTRARHAGVDALLTDFPLECREAWRKGK